MIVTINDSNRENYNKLFIESYKYLKNQTNEDGSPKYELEDRENGFKSLPEYYSHMNDFFETGGWKYIFLPLDEKDFKIDLNTRNITIPAEFSKLVGVQSDNLAEMIIFSVDRYFDYMDLANTNIYVQWKLPDGQNGATRITMIDLSTPDTLRFGWPITDLITQQSGAVKFSVRFFRVAPGDDSTQKMVYSLNTLENSVNIVAAHRVDLPTEVEEPAGLFGEVVINSNFYEEGVAPALVPSFIENILKEENGKLVSVSKANLNNDTLKLYAEAITHDNGDLKYEWHYLSSVAGSESINCAGYEVDDEGNVIDEEKTEAHAFATTNFKVSNVMIPFEAPRDADKNIDWSIGYVQGQRYYKAENIEEDEITEIASLSGSGFTRVVDVKSSQEEVLYRYFSCLTILPSANKVIVTGEYSAYAWNVISANNISNSDMTNECVLPSPAAVTIEEDLKVDENFIPCELKVSVPRDEDSVDVLTYTWYKSIDGTTFEEVSMTTEDELTPESLKVEDRGWYKVEVTATANRETTEPKSSNVAKVTAEPIAPIFNKKDDFNAADYTFNLNNIGENNKVTFTAAVENGDNELYSESITYQWYVNVADQIENEKEINNQTDTLVITEDMDIGFYHCVATNNLNGKSASTHSHDVGMGVTVFAL